MTLEAFLATAARTPFAWATHDCCTFAADWVIARRGVDPMAGLRRRYRTAAGALSLIGRGGGLVALWRAGCAGAGLSEADVPIVGDVGVIETTTEHGLELVGAIRAASDWAGQAWAVLGPGGLTYANGPHAATWRV